MSAPIPALRLRALNDAPVRAEGAFVLYWMNAAHRPCHNFALQRAVEWAETLHKPLVVLQSLRRFYPWASERFHQFLLDGMADVAAAFEGRPVTHYPYVEPGDGAPEGFVPSLAAHACVVVTDDFPAFLHPVMLPPLAAALDVRFEAVDSNGLLPMRAADRAYPTAYAFRRFLQQTLPAHLFAFPERDPLAGKDLPRLAALPAEVVARWPLATPATLRGGPAVLAGLAVDPRVAPVAGRRGGFRAGRATLERFVAERLARYAEDHNQPDPAREATSGLSPYLHFGFVSAHEVFERLVAHEHWAPTHLAAKASGARAGWWGASPAAEAFLDQFVTWRELGYNFCAFRADYDRYESLPEWALSTLEVHAADARPQGYTLAEFEAARTHDPLWNAAQTQLKREGLIHNYLRMLWGKKILHWSASPREALATMIELNNKYALDGRDPNSYSGIFWTLGRYDRPWGPERPIFGKVRYMTSENTARKFKLDGYLARYAPDGER